MITTEYAANEVRTCVKCEVPKPIDAFRWIRRPRHGVMYKFRTNTCIRCLNLQKNEEIANDRSRAVLKNCRKHDRASGFPACDLDLVFVREVIAKPCTYCGESETTMTLDRIDNSLGHSKANVVGACFRCNMIKSNMPYAAWLAIVPGVRKARKAGLFGSWGGLGHARLRKVVMTKEAPKAFDLEVGGPPGSSSS